jgi:GDP-L-fucose synthase
MKVLVTGGSGMCGKALQRIRPEWTYVDSKMYGSLTKLENVQKMYADIRPDVVIHLAAKVGGILLNMNNQMAMYEDNILMNTYVLGEAARAGVSKVINILSTCIFPDNPQLTMTPELLHSGPPAETNAGYAYAKRMAHFHSELITKNTKTKVINLIPTNLYGPNDNFSGESGHVIPSLIRKAAAGTLSVMGSGSPLRQFMHVDDFARIMTWAVETSDVPLTFVCAPEEEYTIKYIAELIGKEYGLEAVFEPGPDGQYRKYSVPGPGDFPRPQIGIQSGLRDTIIFYNNIVCR